MFQFLTFRRQIDHSFRFFHRFNHFPVVLSLTAYAYFFASCRVCCIAKFQLVVSYWLEHRVHDFSIEETISISEFYRSISDTSAISYFVELQPAFVLICVYSLGYYYWDIILDNDKNKYLRQVYLSYSKMVSHWR